MCSSDLHEHVVERVARVVVGLGLIGGALTGVLGAWGDVGVVLLVTGAA